MTFTSLIRPLMAGILHSFEPDHVTAVSVLATENAINKTKVSIKSVFKASQWALGHSVTLLLFGGIALIFKSGAKLVCARHFFLGRNFCRANHDMARNRCHQKKS